MFWNFKRKKKQKMVRGPINKSVISKAIEMKDAKIKYLSLVDKPANGVEFLVKKGKDGQPEFKLSASIIKSKNETHEITGVVYEPYVEDAHGNFMSPGEIKKASDWFNENGFGSDIQHNENIEKGVKITKSWVLEEDTEIEGKIYKSGTWLASAQIVDDEIWSKIEKGEITGWSMGGSGTYVMDEVNIDDIKNQVEESIIKKIGKSLGIIKDDTIEKGQFLDKYKESAKRRNFWTAFDTLQNILYPWETNTLINDSNTIKEALTEFSETIQEILTGSNEEIVKSVTLEKELVIAKAGKKISVSNKKKLQTIVDEATALLKLDNNEEEEEVMKAEDITQVTEAVLKALEAKEEAKKKKKKDEEDVSKSLTSGNSEDNQAELIAKAVGEAMAPVMKSLGIEPEKELTMEEKIAKTVAAEVSKAVEPIYKARGIKKSLTSDEQGSQDQPVAKSYMKYFDEQ